MELSKVLYIPHPKGTLTISQASRINAAGDFLAVAIILFISLDSVQRLKD
jgi:hypothetical protein